jgi:hypothetical protein
MQNIGTAENAYSAMEQLVECNGTHPGNISYGLEKRIDFPSVKPSAADLLSMCTMRFLITCHKKTLVYV